MLKIEADDDMVAALTLLDRAEETTQGTMRANAAAAINAQWVPALTAAATGAQQRKLLVSGAGADVNNVGFDLIAGRGPDLSGGLGSDHWYAVDYGMTPKQVAAPNRRRTVRLGAGRTFQVAVLIWVGRNLPPREPAGRVVWPTIGEKAPVFVSAWIDGLVQPLEGPTLDVDPSELEAQVSGSWR